ncbi:hypothetical protein BDN72DRAFT_87277 [Pluteus cervinus]|uniref:Uncharacterized protein n=1 Tax=Pluteus cervinus TaxID=181527 RepID=A0ACD3AQA4_9AGAR|nr:hypothetical protein BDN72DRAFT_87277 [Pluteus cervinus]
MLSPGLGCWNESGQTFRLLKRFLLLLRPGRAPKQHCHRTLSKPNGCFTEGRYWKVSQKHSTAYIEDLLRFDLARQGLRLCHVRLACGGSCMSVSVGCRLLNATALESSMILRNVGTSSSVLNDRLLVALKFWDRPQLKSGFYHQCGVYSVDEYIDILSVLVLLCTTQWPISEKNYVIAADICTKTFVCRSPGRRRLHSVLVLYEYISQRLGNTQTGA